MFKYDKYDVKDYVKLQCHKEVGRQLNHSYLSVVERLVHNDARTRAIFDRHAADLEAKLERKATALLADTTVRANLTEAARRDNERRMAQLEASYRWDVRVAKWLSGAALLGLAGIVGARLVVLHSESKQ